MKPILAGLALGALALLSARQVAVWDTDAHLWAHAHAVEPLAPRPLVNLALVQMHGGDLFAAESLLHAAQTAATAQAPADRAWSEDVILANLASLKLRQGDRDGAQAIARTGGPLSLRRAAICGRWVTCD